MQDDSDEDIHSVVSSDSSLDKAPSSSQFSEATCATSAARLAKKTKSHKRIRKNTADETNAEDANENDATQSQQKFDFTPLSPTSPKRNKRRVVAEPLVPTKYSIWSHTPSSQLTQEPTQEPAQEQNDASENDDEDGGEEEGGASGGEEGRGSGGEEGGGSGGEEQAPDYEDFALSQPSSPEPDHIIAAPAPSHTRSFKQTTLPRKTPSQTQQRAATPSMQKSNSSSSLTDSRRSRPPPPAVERKERYAAPPPPTANPYAEGDQDDTTGERPMHTIDVSRLEEEYWEEQARRAAEFKREREARAQSILEGKHDSPEESIAHTEARDNPLKWCGWTDKSPMEAKIAFIRDLGELGVTSNPDLFAKFILTLEDINNANNVGQLVWDLFSNAPRFASMLQRHHHASTGRDGQGNTHGKIEKSIMF